MERRLKPVRKYRSIGKKNPLDGSAISLGIERDGEIQTLSLKPQMTKQVDTGFIYNLYREKTNFLGVLRYSASEVRYWISNTIESLMMLIKGQFSVMIFQVRWELLMLLAILMKRRKRKAA